ncbi:mariner Mos1 transposase [Trichonephila clavipes]|nr:mariner Mos1 transposase [Trichonephila clavipes]
MFEDVEDQHSGEREKVFEDAELEAFLDQDSCQTQQESAGSLGVTQQAISKRLKLLARQRWKGFLHRIVTGDEKCIRYDNPKRRKSWGYPGHASTSTAKPNIHGSKVMLSIWWDQLGVVYYELLKPTETITGDRYRTQLMHLSRALKDKRPQYNERHHKVILQHDNARTHVAKVVKTYMETLKWEVQPHPLYSPDLAPSDYQLFRLMIHDLADQHFRSYKEIMVLYSDGSKPYPGRTGSVVYATAEDGLDIVLDSAALTTARFSNRSLLNSESFQILPSTLKLVTHTFDRQHKCN